jgi:hypothetical protein
MNFGSFLNLTTTGRKGKINAMKCIAALLFLICFSLLGASVAQELLVGDLPVSLGDKEQLTIDWFKAKGYTLDHELNNRTELVGHNFAVRDKSNTIVGVLGFQDGKLDYASTFFFTDLGSAPSANLFAKILFEQLRQLKDDDLLSHCVIGAKETASEGGMSKEVSFTRNQKTMVMFISPA